MMQKRLGRVRWTMGPEELVGLRLLALALRPHSCRVAGDECKGEGRRDTNEDYGDASGSLEGE